MLSESVVHRPPAALRPFVAEAVGYRYEGLVPALHRGLPSPFLTLVLPLDEPLVLAAHPDPHQPPGSFDALVGGLHTCPALISTGIRQAGIQLSLTVPGARALLGVPAGTLASLDLHLDDVLGPVAGELVGRMRAVRTWPARFAALDDVLLRLADRRAPKAATELREAWRLTSASGGQLPVAELAARVGWWRGRRPRRPGRRLRLRRPGPPDPGVAPVHRPAAPPVDGRRAPDAAAGRGRAPIRPRRRRRLGVRLTA